MIQRLIIITRDYKLKIKKCFTMNLLLVTLAESLVTNREREFLRILYYSSIVGNLVYKR